MYLHLEKDNMEIINITYVDDNIDSFITDYLLEEYNFEGIETNYSEISFKEDDDYEKLLNNNDIKIANIIIIDSSLFKEESIHNLFTGEEFKIILKKYFPYIEVIIVSQNNCPDFEYGIIEKFKESKRGNKTSKEYYDEKLKPFLDEAIKNILISRNILKKLNKNNNLNNILKDKIENSMNGIVEYDELTSKDINNLINEFKKMEKNFL